MKLNKLPLISTDVSVFQLYLLSHKNVKQLCKEFEFYKVLFYKENLTKDNIVYLQYPKGNVYWFLDFKKYVKTHFLDDINCPYHVEWNNLLLQLKTQIKAEFNDLKYQLESSSKINASTVLLRQIKYQLRDYQAYDLSKFLIKYEYWNNRGLILSEPRTGKTRIALAGFIEIASLGDLALIICPKSAAKGWQDELKILESTLKQQFNVDMITKMSELKKLTAEETLLNFRIISYDLFKKLTIPQIRQLTSKIKNIVFIGDEIHRLRNFKTDQSKAIYNFKTFCEKDKVSLGIIGLTGTPAVKESSDIFGVLSLLNDSKIKFQPTYDSFDCFKEYFYYCEDTSFGKCIKALRKEQELNFLIQNCSVQTKQKELALFKNYTKKYIRVDLKMDEEQKRIYNSVYNDMMYDDDIDCQNKLVQLIRLQQICIDPFGLVSSYDNISPKLKWVTHFALKNSFKFIVACKKTTPLKHLMEIFYSLNLEYASLLGEYSYKERLNQIDNFKNNPNCKCIFLQLDTGREALTLPMAQAIIFLDRDFAQGFNEQAEARMTPVDGSTCTKYVIDLIMQNTKEDQIYHDLVIKKKSLDKINFVFKKKGVSE